MDSSKLKSIEHIIKHYERTVKNLEQQARQLRASESRPYGGYLRATKGKLLEDITESLVRIAWRKVGGAKKRLAIGKDKVFIPIQRRYINNKKTDEPALYHYLLENISNLNYKLSVDKHINIDGELVMAIECKSYSENAMLKRICQDFSFIYRQHPKVSCVLQQFESQLGGDYSKLGGAEQGSPSTHTILSYFPFDLKIITLLEGERDIDRPFHKPLPRASLEYAIKVFEEKLKPFA